MLKKYSPKVKNELIKKVNSGASVTSACREMHIPVGTAYAWINKANRVKKTTKKIDKQRTQDLAQDNKLVLQRSLQEVEERTDFGGLQELKSAMLCLTKERDFYKRESEFYRTLAFNEFCRVTPIHR